ncbi:recombinase family protein [Streptomyces kaempferi]
MHLESAITVVRRVVRCFIYARISEDREGAHLATERQTDDCRDLAEQLSTPQVEYRVVRVFEDNDLSAYSGKPRPDYLEMLAALRNGEGDCVLAWHTDRLHRSPVELEEYIDVCAPADIDTRTVKAGQLDLTTATGRWQARQLGAMARFEVERQIERQKRAREQKASHGEYAGGPRPFGYEAAGSPREHWSAWTAAGSGRTDSSRSGSATHATPPTGSPETSPARHARHATRCVSCRSARTAAPWPGFSPGPKQRRYGTRPRPSWPGRR